MDSLGGAHHRLPLPCCVRSLIEYMGGVHYNIHLDACSWVLYSSWVPFIVGHQIHRGLRYEKTRRTQFFLAVFTQLPLDDSIESLGAARHNPWDPINVPSVTWRVTQECPWHRHPHLGWLTWHPPKKGSTGKWFCDGIKIMGPSGQVAAGIQMSISLGSLQSPTTG